MGVSPRVIKHISTGTKVSKIDEAKKEIQNKQIYSCWAGQSFITISNTKFTIEQVQFPKIFKLFTYQANTLKFKFKQLQHRLKIPIQFDIFI